MQVYAILDEVFLAGEIEETSKQVVLTRLEHLDKLEWATHGRPWGYYLLYVAYNGRVIILYPDTITTGLEFGCLGLLLCT